MIGFCALMYAGMKGNVEIAPDLVQAGAWKDAATPNGAITQSLADENGYTAISALLA